MTAAKTLEFYFDFVSPYSYLALTRLEALQHAHGFMVELVPFPLLELMARVGNRPTSVECAPKSAYVLTDLARWATAYGVAFKLNPHSRKIERAALLNGAASAIAAGEGEAYVRTVFKAFWAQSAPLADDAEVIARLLEGGVQNAEAIWTGRDVFADQISVNVERAVRAGVFGAPSFVIGADLYFGNDRLDFVQESLAA